MTVPKADINSKLQSSPGYIRPFRDPSLSAIERFDAQDGREMTRDLAPALTLVETGKHRAAIGPKVESHRLALVTSHGLPKNGEVAGFLWQSIAHGLPGLAPVS